MVTLYVVVGVLFGKYAIKQATTPAKSPITIEKTNNNFHLEF